MRNSVLLRARAIIAVPLLAAAAACGDDPAAPTPTEVSGIYQVVDVSEDAVCTPPSALDILSPTMGSGTFRLTLRVEDLGDQVRFRPLAVEGGVVDTTQASQFGLAPDGTIDFPSTTTTGHYTLHDRAFYEEVKDPGGFGKFDREANPITFTLSWSTTHVFREGTANDPVFATCTQSGSSTGTRTGNANASAHGGSAGQSRMR
jgi:hypothetical protein